jgi:hypothetical protein
MCDAPDVSRERRHAPLLRVSYHVPMKAAAILCLVSAGAFGADTLRVFDRAWTVPVAADWKVEKQDDGQVLRLVQHRGPLPGPRRPIQFALTDLPKYRTLRLEVDVKPLGSSLLLVFAYRNPAQFDYAHLSVDTGEKQPVHNGIFHVYGGDRERISQKEGAAAFAATGRWYHVKLTHDAQTGTVDVTVDNQAAPALHATDLSLTAGKTGVGSFDETGEFKNVTISTTP